ncbi:unnamed protein product [Prorocentrum cordatum]|uniref:Uncharacterized protein n=1 Tax=Prorocentrum cordatum TaxID=2364126 RepID=A0ABN9PGN2_9DINO|nr:unnamed protein product [Polarella glacialis]
MVPQPQQEMTQPVGVILQEAAGRMSRSPAAAVARALQQGPKPLRGWKMISPRDRHRSAFQCSKGRLSCSTTEEWCAHKEPQCVHVRCKCIGGVAACPYDEASIFRPIGGNQCNLTVAGTARSRAHHRHYTAKRAAKAAKRAAKKADPPGFKNDAYVELRSDPMAGGFLQQEPGGGWSVWPRMGGKSFEGFLGYGYQRVRAEGGRVAKDIVPEEWDLVQFPVARTGGADGGDSFYTDGDRAHRGDYTNLVGKTFRFTISGLGGLDCGCNANFYAVRMGAGCDGSGNNGDLCEEIDFFEGNKFAWHSTLHTLADSGETDANGLCTGYGGTLPTKPNFPSFDGTEYGPDGTMIDTEKDFHVAVSFPKGKNGKLKGMAVELSQDGKPSMEQPLFMHLYAYEGSLYTEPGGGGGLKVENGMDKVERRMNDGVTMLSSLWSGGMRWLDGAASEHGDNNIMDGKCTWDGECAGYTVSGISVEDIPEPTPAPVEASQAAAVEGATGGSGARQETPPPRPRRPLPRPGRPAKPPAPAPGAPPPRRPPRASRTTRTWS